MDGAFLDDVDIEWVFWQREAEYKWRLYSDYVGRVHPNSMQVQKACAAEKATRKQDATSSGSTLYSQQRFSKRIGHHIPDSNQALTRTRYDWLEMAKEENLGAPTAMTTVVANIRTSTIRAHVLRGPCARPDPEDSVSFLVERRQGPPILEHASIQTADYLRRRREFESYAYRSGYDALRGRCRARLRRRESQKRGFNHDHYNEFAETCGLPSSPASCHSVSRWCLRTGIQCRLPAECDGTAYHTSHHNAHATAELCRPYPVGSVSEGPPSPPKFDDGASLQFTQKELQSKFWTTARLKSDTSQQLLSGSSGSHSSGNVQCIGTLRERMQAALENLPSRDRLRMNSPMSFEDLLVAYYCRKLQTEQMCHVCKLGYCRATWSTPCKFNLPWKTVVPVMYQDDELDRLIPRRSNLDDDAWMKVHSLPLLVRSLMNIQINQHHPEAGTRGLGYSIKYDLKSEPQTRISVHHHADDAVTEYLRGQFVSVSQAAAFVLEDPITDSTHGASPLAFPCWTVQSNTSCQGLWRRYTTRLPYQGLNAVRKGYTHDVQPEAMRISIVFATFTRLMRYFGEERQAQEHSATAEGEAPKNQEAKDESKKSKLHPEKLTRYIWDGVLDDPKHPDFDPVLTELLPGEKLLLQRQALKTDAFRRLRNGRLHFARFIEYDLSLQKDAHGVSMRTQHFQVRLFKLLPWMSLETPDNWNCQAILSPLPPGVTLDNAPLSEYLGFGLLRDIPDAHKWMSPSMHDMQVFWLKDSILNEGTETPTEYICLHLEQALQSSGAACECCKQEVSSQCSWCLRAYGWHRCRKLIDEGRKTLSDVLSDATAFRWKPHTLYNTDGHDIDACVLSMLSRAVSQKKICCMLENLLGHELIDQGKYQELLRLVLARTNAIVDSSDIFPHANQQLVLPHASNRDAQDVAAKLRALEEKMQQLWDPANQQYDLWYNFTPQRRVPSQYLVFQQLKFRLEAGEPIIVGIVAPAGYGKSELIAAFLLHAQSCGYDWKTMAVTGVAATQISGSTIHNFLFLRGDGETKILQYPEQREKLARVQGIIVDEAMMAEDEVIFKLAEVLQEVPLHPSLRRVRPDKAIRFWGYRDVIFCGDVRQLPPASGRQPFWSTQTFQRLVEIFCLREDRRHERDLEMQAIKEKFAWGGTLPPKNATPQHEWPVDRDVFDFVAEGYLRGWGLTGHNIDLDVGTALFPRRPDVRRWNEACVKQIEQKFGDSCEGVDIHGYDPRHGREKQETGKAHLSGIQTPWTLQLRTCPQHRQRVMLLHNLDVANGWANGTRARLLPRSSWTGAARPLQKNVDGSWSAHQVKLSDTQKYPDFNVRVVKDEDATLAKTMRYDDTDCQVVPVRIDTGSHWSQEWAQVQLVLANALTGHKAQGLTMYVTYIALNNVFGFGLPYTLVTRTPFKNNMFFIGIPPRDILRCLLARGPDGLNMIERKRKEILELCCSPERLEACLEDRIRNGEFDLQQIGENILRQEKTAGLVPQSDTSAEANNEDRHRIACKRARKQLSETLQAWMQNWAERLQTNSGLKAICQVSEGFKWSGSTVEPHANRHHMWQSLAQILQQDSDNRERILYYRAVTDWMSDPAVDVVHHCVLDRPYFPTRAFSSSHPPEIDGTLLGYTVEETLLQRPPCPKPPPDFKWGVGKLEKKAADVTEAKQPEPKDKQEKPTCHNNEEHESHTDPSESHPLVTSVPRRVQRTENVAITVDSNLIELQRMKRTRIKPPSTGKQKRRRLTGKQSLPHGVASNDHAPNPPDTSPQDDATTTPLTDVAVAWAPDATMPKDECTLPQARSGCHSCSEPPHPAANHAIHCLEGSEAEVIEQSHEQADCKLLGTQSTRLSPERRQDETKAMRAASAAESRVRDAFSRGIGDTSMVQRREEESAQQAAAGTSELFGAARAHALRDSLQRSRAARRTAETFDPLHVSSSSAAPAAEVQTPIDATQGHESSLARSGDQTYTAPHSNAETKPSARAVKRKSEELDSPCGASTAMSNDSGIPATNRASQQEVQTVESESKAILPAEACGGCHPCASTAASSDLPVSASASTTAASAANSVAPARDMILPRSAHLAEIRGDIYTGTLDLGYSLASDISVDSTNCGLLNLGKQCVLVLQQSVGFGGDRYTDRLQTDRQEPHRQETDKQGRRDNKKRDRKDDGCRTQSNRKHTDHRQIGNRQHPERNNTHRQGTARQQPANKQTENKQIRDRLETERKEVTLYIIKSTG